MFSLRSLFALIACFAILLGLILTFISSARESARRMSCSNNLRQLGLAVHNYESAYKAMPPAFLEHNQLSWTVSLQPMFDSSSLYDSINKASGPFYALGKNDPHGLVRLPVHLCPSAETDRMEMGPPNDVSPVDLVPPHSGVPPFTIHYYGISGPLGPLPRSDGEYPVASALTFEGAPVAGSGVFQWNSRVTFGSISDGLSWTLFFGEMSWNSPKYGTRYRSWLNGGTDGSFVVGCRNIARPINSHRLGPVQKPFSNMPMGSQHSGGAQFCLADGSVRFLQQDIDFRIYQALASRDGQEKFRGPADADELELLPPED